MKPKITLGEGLFLFALSIPLTVFKAFIATKVWALTMVPLMGTPQIGLWQAFAISWMIGVFSTNGKDLDSSSENGFAELLGKQVAVALVLLLTWGLTALIF